MWIPDAGIIRVLSQDDDLRRGRQQESLWNTWVAYSKRTRYCADNRVRIRAKFIENLNVALVTPLTMGQVAEIRYGERPDLDGPGNNPIL